MATETASRTAQWHELAQQLRVDSIRCTTALPSSGVTPTAENGQGTFGRGQLDPQTRRLLLVNRIDEPVFAYQLPDAPR